MPNEKLDNLFRLLKRTGNTKAKDINEFGRWMSGEGYRRGLYKNLADHQVGGIGGSYEEFSRITGYGDQIDRAQAQTRAQAQRGGTSKASAALRGVQQKAVQPTQPTWSKTDATEQARQQNQAVYGSGDGSMLLKENAETHIPSFNPAQGKDKKQVNKEWAEAQAEEQRAYMEAAHPSYVDAVRAAGGEKSNIWEATAKAQEADVARRMERIPYDKENLGKLYDDVVKPVFDEEKARGEEEAKAHYAKDYYNMKPGEAIGYWLQREMSDEKYNDPARITGKTLARVENSDEFTDYIYGRMGITPDDKQDNGDEPQLSSGEIDYLKRMTAKESEEVAEKMQQRMYEEYKKAGAPKSALDYIASKAFNENFLVTLSRAMIRRTVHSSGLRQQLRQQMNDEYGKTQSWGVRAAGGAAPFAVDMLTGGFAIPSVVGSTVVKGGVRMAARQVEKRAIERAVASGISEEAAKRTASGVAQRYLATQAPVLNIALRSAGGAANFATYDAQSEIVRQIDEGVFEPIDILKRAGHGAVLGAAMGVVGGAIGHATRNASRMGKVAGDALGVGAETGIFAVSGAIEKAQQDGVSIVDVDWGEQLGESLGTVLGMKTVGHVMHPGTLVQRYRKSANYDLKFDEHNLEELKEAGYDLSSVFKGLGEMGKVAPLNELVRTEEVSIDPGLKKRSVATEERVDADTFNAIMADPRVSSDTKGKVYYLATGNILRPEPVYGVTLTQNENGTAQIETFNAKGDRISIRDYKNGDKAKAEHDRLLGEARMNSVAALEQVCERLENNGRKQGEGFQTGETASRPSIVDTARNRTQQETGVDVQDVLMKKQTERTEEENAVIDSYIKNLQDEFMQRNNERMARLNVDGADRRGYETGATENPAKDKEAIRRELLETSEAAKEMFDAETMQSLQTNPVETLARLARENEGSDNAAVKTALAYVNAQTAYSAMIRRVNDDVDNAVNAAHEEVNQNTNKQSGMLQQVTLKAKNGEDVGEQVYVIDGEVQMLEDGSGVDKTKSQKDIIIRDSKGEVRFADIDEIASVATPVDAEQVKQAEGAKIEQQMVDNASREIEGLPMYEANDVVELANGERVVVTGVEETEGGKVVTMQVQTEEGVQPLQMKQEDLDGNVSKVERGGEVVYDKTSAPATGQEVVTPAETATPKAEAAAPAAETTTPVTTPAAETSAAPIQQSNEQVSAMAKIPTAKDGKGQTIVDKKGQPIYEWHKASVADTADALTEQVGGEVADAITIANAQAKNAEKELKKAQNAKVTDGSPLEMAAQMRANRARANEAQQIVDHWKNVASELERRTQEPADVPEMVGEPKAQVEEPTTPTEGAADETARTTAEGKEAEPIQAETPKAEDVKASVGEEESEPDKLYEAYEREQGTVDEEGGLVKDEVSERLLSPLWRGALHAFGRLIGKRVVVLSREDYKNTGYEGTHGFTVGNTIYLNEEYIGRSDGFRGFITGHEFTHILKRTLRSMSPELWDAYVESVKAAMGKDFDEQYKTIKKRYDAFYKAYNEKHPDKPLKFLDKNDIEEEICCDWAGQNVLTDADAIRKVVQNAENAGADPVKLTKRILDWVNEWLTKLRNWAKGGVDVSEEIEAAERAKQIWQEMYNVSVARQNEKKVIDAIKQEKDLTNKREIANAALDQAEFSIATKKGSEKEQAQEKQNALLEERREFTKENRGDQTQDQDVRFSLDTTANQYGLRYVKGEDGTTHFYEDKGMKDGKPILGKEIKKFKPEHIDHSPVGAVLRNALSSGVITPDIYQKTLEEQAAVLNYFKNTPDLDMFFAVSGAIGYAQLPDNAKEVQRDYYRVDSGGNVAFVPYKSNSEDQYDTTFDVTTICRKTQTMIDVMSQTMKELKHGLTVSEVIKIVYDNVYKLGKGRNKDGHDVMVPCNVCYVFNRWVNLGNLFDTMRRLRDQYDNMSVDDIKAEREKLIEDLCEYYRVTGDDKEFRTYREYLDARDAYRAMRERGESGDEVKVEQARLAAFTKKGGALKRAMAKRKKAIDARVEKLNFKIFNYEMAADKSKVSAPTEAEYEELEALRRELNYLDKGTWFDYVRLQEDYMPIPDEVLFDINKSYEFKEKYPGAWKYRTTRGSGMGKAASAYAPEFFGSGIVGRASGPDAARDMSKNLFLARELDADGNWHYKYINESDWTLKPEAKVLIRKARDAAAAQNYNSGQRFQSTSDTRVEYLPDYNTYMLEQTIIGSKAQGFTKVPESAKLFGDTGAMFNMSLIARGKGYEELTEEQYNALSDEDKRDCAKIDGVWLHALYSDVSGINHKDAFALNDAYPNLQPIMVCLNREHARLSMALANTGRIPFNIPYHASGDTLEYFTSKSRTVGEDIDPESYEDYTKVEVDQVANPRDETAKKARSVFVKIKTGATFTADEMKYLNSLPEDNVIRQLYMRFKGEDVDGKPARILNKYLLPEDRGEDGYGTVDHQARIPEWDSKTGEDLKDENGNTVMKPVVMQTKQGALLMPNDYWDKTLRLEDADRNGDAFVELCNQLGLYPRFGGWYKPLSNGKFVYDKDKDFTKEPGYWSTLIDVAMYDLDGNPYYQRPINASQIGVGHFDMKQMVTLGEHRLTPMEANPEADSEVIQDIVSKSVQDVRKQRERDKIEFAKTVKSWMEDTGKRKGKLFGGVRGKTIPTWVRNAWDTDPSFVREVGKLAGLTPEELEGLSEQQPKLSVAERVRDEKVKDSLGLGESETETEETEASIEAAMNGEAQPKFSIVEDPKEIERLEKEPTITVYRSVQVGKNGELRSPMASKVGNPGKGKTETSSLNFNRWEKADEHPELADENGRITLDKGGGNGTLPVAYNPYIHTSRSMINDQFSSAWKRDNIRVIATEIPVSELTAGYHADKAKNSVGELPWKSGPVGRKLPEDRQRKVILTRWDKPIDFVPWEQVADDYAKTLDGLDIEVPFNVIPKDLLPLLEERGVKIGEPEKGTAGRASMEAYEEWKKGKQPKFSLVEDNISDELNDKGISVNNKKLLDEYGLSNLTLSKSGDHVTLSKIVSADKGKGNGTRFMEDLTKLADKNGWTLALTPDTSFGGTSVSRLKDFYKRFGFKDNKGRSTDFETRESMVRRPQEQPKFSLVDNNEKPLEEKTKVIFDTAKKKFGTTRDIREAGYVLPDGTMLDFSGRHELLGADDSGISGRRTSDHRSIGSISYVYDKDGNEVETGVETDMPDFIERGAIRIDNNAGTINLIVKPTQQQRDVLARLIRNNGGDVTIDFGNGWDTYHSVDYYGAKYPRILNDISRYFDEGIRPEGNQPRFSVSSTPFYSNAEKAVEGIRQEKATPEQWLKMIEKNGGLKAGEDKWMGLSEWLNQRKTAGHGGSITKQEVLDFIRENQIQVEEVNYADTKQRAEEESDQIGQILGIPIESDSWLRGHYGLHRNEYGNIELGVSGNQRLVKDTWDAINEKFGRDNYESEREFREMLANMVESDLDTTRSIDPTRLKYTTRGLENKKEIALVVPTVESWNEGDEIHFGDAGEGRAVAWVRFGETTDADGKKVLVIDEIQSKRHQEGRERGYKDESKVDNLKQEYKEAQNALKEAYNKADKFRDEDGNLMDDAEGYDDAMQEIDNASMRMRELEEELRLARRSYDDAIPDAPFEKNWHELAMKRMLRYAAENGYDKVAWTKGEQQAERYNLAKTIPSITRQDTKKAADKGIKVFAMDINGEPEKIFVDNEGTITNTTLLMVEVTGKPLSDFVGKEIAIRMMSMNDGETIDTSKEKVGGEGMKGFYDQMLPRFMDKYGKKWGVKTGEVELPNVEEAGRKMWSVDVTPEMKESVMQGQPMFRVAEEFDDGQELKIERTPDGYRVEGVHADYDTPEQLLDAFRNRHEAYVARMSEDGTTITVEPWSKYLGEPSKKGKAGEKQKEYQERKTRNAQEAVQTLADKLGLNVEVKMDTDGLEGRRGKVKGMYDPKTGKITVVLPNHTSQQDVMRTILHEGVGHHGLRRLFGDSFNDFLRNVYDNATPEVRARINRTLGKHGFDNLKATEEYLSVLAEDTAFDDAVNRSWWSKVKAFFLDMLAKAGIKLDRALTDNELRYILWRSYKNLEEERAGNVERRKPQGEKKAADVVPMGRKNMTPNEERQIVADEQGGVARRDVIDTAHDIAMQYRLGVGNFQREGAQDGGDPNGGVRFSVDEQEEKEKWERKYDDDLEAWKKDNGIAADADGLRAKPTLGTQGVIAYAKELADWNREKAIWDTAPDKEDYLKQAEYEASRKGKEEEAVAHPGSDVKQLQAWRAALRSLMQAARKQKRYDRDTVKAIATLAREYLRMGYGDHMKRGDVGRLLAAIKNATGAKNVRKHLDTIMDIMIDNQLRNLEASLKKVSSVKDVKKNAVGVSVQGKLDVKGQRTMKAYRDWRERTVDELEARVSELQNKIAERPEDIGMLEDELQGVMLAMQYVRNVKAKKTEITDLKNEREDAVREFESSGRSREAQKALLESIDNAIMETKLEMIGEYGRLLGEMNGALGEAVEGAKEFKKREEERIENIHHMANSDTKGMNSNVFREAKDKTLLQKVGENPFVRLILSSLPTMEQMLKQFGRRNSMGEGKLYKYFMDKWRKAEGAHWLSEQAVKKEMDDKVKEVFGRKARYQGKNGKLHTFKPKRWSDLYELVRHLPTMDVEITDASGPHTVTLTQGNLLYIYMANKMSDGEMKLRKMGITGEQVALIKEFIDPRLVELGNWLQEELLPSLRSKYNAVHERLFGAPMAEIDNYFPLRIKDDARHTNVDINKDENADGLPTTVTGSIINRTKNTTALDILGADALSVAIEHVEEMERWAAFAEFSKDVNTLLSHKTFRNKVKNMTTVYGSGEQLWKTFMDVMKMAAGTYRPKVSNGSVDKFVTNLAKGVTGAKISFRIHTALKQLLSFPAFIHDANPAILAKNTANPIGSWKWAMENLPMLQKRYKGRAIGDTRLMESDNDWDWWKKNWVQKLSVWGISPNAFIDALTCSIGARSIYESRYKRYKKYGYSDEKAREKALMDAELGYNLTQQSSEGAMVSAIQMDRTVMANMLSVFRNASFSYTRQVVDAMRNLKHRYADKNYKQESIEFMTQQYIEDGLSEEQARKAATKDYWRTGWHEWLKLGNMMLGVTFLWNLGPSLMYLLFGDDDDKKKNMLVDASLKAMLAGPVEGLVGGSIISDIAGMVASHEGVDPSGLRNYNINPLPFFSDLNNLVKESGYDQMGALQDLMWIAAQSTTGVNPETFTNMAAALLDYANGDPAEAREIGLFIMRLMNTPEESARNYFIDEIGLRGDQAQQKSYEELAQRYARYRHNKSVPIMGWFYSEEEEGERLEKLQQSFDKKVQERMNMLTDDELNNIMRKSDSVTLKEMAEKILTARTTGLSDNEVMQQYQDGDSPVHDVVRKEMKDRMSDMPTKRLDSLFNATDNDSVKNMVGQAIGKAMGQKDTYGMKQRTEYGEVYQHLRTTDDLYEDMALADAKNKAKAAGDKDREKAIERERRIITDIKRGLEDEGKNPDEVMKEVRDYRRQVIDAYGIKVKR